MQLLQLASNPNLCFSSIPILDYAFFLIIRDAALEHDGLQHFNTVGITGLEFLDLSGNDLATEGFPVIRDFVCKQINLSQLLLDDNELEDEGGVSKINLMTFPSTCCITQPLPGCFLDLWWQQLRANSHTPLHPSLFHSRRPTSGAEHVANVLSDSDVLPNLTELSLSSNEIGNDGAKAIVESLTGKTKMTRLNLNSNKVSESQIEELIEILEKQV
jgi:hypothetical protein